MTIQFNNIPTTIRTPDALAEFEASQALQGLVAVPHRFLLLGIKIAAGSKPNRELCAISREGYEDVYFGPGSPLARMCKFFKRANQNLDLYAMALSQAVGAIAASMEIDLSACFKSATLSTTAVGTWNLLVCGEPIDYTLASGQTPTAAATAIKTLVNTSAYSHLPIHCSASGCFLLFSAVASGTEGNYLRVKQAYYPGQSTPACFSVAPTIGTFAGGTGDPDLDDAWAVIPNDQFHGIGFCMPDTAAEMASMDSELTDRFGPLENKAGHAYTAKFDTQANLTTYGNLKNSLHVTCMGAYRPPQGLAEWVGALTAVVGGSIEQHPARPCHFLRLPGILPDVMVDRFMDSERRTLLWDGIATHVVDPGGNVLVERAITMYQANVLGLVDPTWLDVQTPMTLDAIRYQYRARMTNRFIIPRFMLAGDTTPVQPGSFICRPKDVKQEIIALFALLQEVGYIEDLATFTQNLVVERDIADVNRVNALLPANLVNQFILIAAKIGFIL